MGINAKALHVLWLVSLLTVANSAISSDLRIAGATEKGDKEAVRSLLKQHADVNSAQADGATALAWAAYRDDLEVTELLIGAGAKVNAANDYGITPLHLACTNGSAAMVERLLAAGAEPTDSILMICARTGNPAAVKAMLAHGANANAKEPRAGQTPLMWAVAQKHLDAARALVEQGADVNAHSSRGFTPLMFGAQQDDLEMVKMLLGAGAKIDDTSADGYTALLVASSSGHEALSIFLLDKGADANAAEEHGLTAMHFAIMKGLAIISRIRLQKRNEQAGSPHLNRPNMVELVKALLARGADPNARVKKLGGIGSPLDWGRGSPGEILPLGATPFLLAAQTYDASLMRMLAEHGADPKVKTEQDVTALMLAAGMNRARNLGSALTDEEEDRAVEACKVALELGVDINATDTYRGMTAVHAAVFNGANKIIRFLAEHGADLNVKDKIGQTPLHVAFNIKPPATMNVERGLVPIILWKDTADTLLKLGAKPLDAATMAQASDSGNEAAAGQ